MVDSKYFDIIIYTKTEKIKQGMHKTEKKKKKSKRAYIKRETTVHRYIQRARDRQTETETGTID